MSGAVRYFHQVRWGAIFRAGGILSTFLAVPWLIDFLGKDGYGRWATLFSLASWVVVFDIGITSGLRNRLVEAIAKGREELAREYVATAYFYFLAFCAVALLLFHLGVHVLRVSDQLAADRDLLSSIMILGSGVIVGFYLMLVHQLYNAMHKSFYVSFYGFLLSFGFLCAVALLQVVAAPPSLQVVAAAYGLVVVLAGLLLNAVFFIEHPGLAPRRALVSVQRLREISGFGLRFFLIQLSALVLFSTDRLMVAFWLGPEQAAEYDVALKYMSVASLLQAVFIAPVWSHAGHLYASGDTSGLRDVLRRQLRIWTGLTLLVLVLGAVYRPLMSFWLGSAFVDYGLMAVCMVFAVQGMWLTVFSSIINGVGKIHVSVWASVLSAIANLPLAYLFAVHLGLGAKGVLLGACLALLPGVFLGPYQLYLIASKRDMGVWAR